MVSIFFKRSKNGYGYFWRSLSRQEEALPRRVIAEKNTRKCYKKCIFLLNRTDFNMAQQFVETIKIVNGKTQLLHTIRKEWKEQSVNSFLHYAMRPCLNWKN